MPATCSGHDPPAVGADSVTVACLASPPTIFGLACVCTDTTERMPANRKPLLPDPPGRSSSLPRAVFRQTKSGTVVPFCLREENSLTCLLRCVPQEISTTVGRPGLLSSEKHSA